MNAASLNTLRILLLLVAAGGLVAQIVVIPVFAAEMATLYPEFAVLQGPYTVAAISVIACVQVMLAAIWMLLSMVARSEIFRDAALRWVEVIIGAAVVATAVTVGTGVHVVFIASTGGPAAFLGLCAALVAGPAFVLLMLVMRGLLVEATTLRSEMAEVV
jgi:hypothetical protein